MRAFLTGSVITLTAVGFSQLIIGLANAQEPAAACVPSGWGTLIGVIASVIIVIALACAVLLEGPRHD